MITFFDIETSGLDKSKHAITQIAAVTLDRSLEVTSEFEVKVKFKLENADPEALEINSYDADLWSEKAIPPFEAGNQFLSYLDKNKRTTLISKKGKPYTVCTLGGHNINGFDIPFLRSWYERLGVSWVPIQLHGIDTYSLAMAYDFQSKQNGNDIGWKNFKLETICEHFGIPIDSHDALSDVKANCQVGKILLSSIKPVEVSA